MVRINFFIAYPGLSNPISANIDVDDSQAFQELIRKVVERYNLPARTVSKQPLVYHFELVRPLQNRVRLASFESWSSLNLTADDTLWLVGESEIVVHLKSDWRDVFKEDLWLSELRIPSKTNDTRRILFKSPSQFVEYLGTRLVESDNREFLPPALEDINQNLRKYIENSQFGSEEFYKKAREVIQILGALRIRDQEKARALSNRPPRIRRNLVRIGIVTALPEECAAVTAILENPKSCPAKSSMRQYIIGEIPSKHGGSHQIVLLPPIGMGNNIAATNVTFLLQEFPNIEEIIMVGIAGGVPSPQKPDEHVRLGDIVVSSEYGVVQYDYVKETMERTTIRSFPRPPSAVMLQTVRLLQMDERRGLYPWERFIAQTCDTLHERRPNHNTDNLFDTCDPPQKIRHPRDSKRRNGYPRVFVGLIGSANKLLKNPKERDQLRDLGVKAVEMEGAGVADAAWFGRASYFIVRGVCDYCDEHKNDVWHLYSAIAAASYTRALLETVPCNNRSK